RPDGHLDGRPGGDRAEARRERAWRPTDVPRAARARVELSGHRVDPAVSDLVMEAVDVHKRFGRLQVLKGISLGVRRGETVCIIGASGSGKTTFIRCINHLEKIDGGRITV